MPTAVCAMHGEPRCSPLYSGAMHVRGAEMMAQTAQLLQVHWVCRRLSWRILPALKRLPAVPAQVAKRLRENATPAQVAGRTA